MHSMDFGSDPVITLAGRRAYRTSEPSYTAQREFGEHSSTYEIPLTNARSIMISFGRDEVTNQALFLIEQGHGVRTVCKSPSDPQQDVFIHGVFEQRILGSVQARLIAPLDQIEKLEHFEPRRDISLAEEKQERGEVVTQPKMDTWVTVRSVPSRGRLASLDLDTFQLRPYTPAAS